MFFWLSQLERAWNSLKWREKLSLGIAVVRGITSSSDISKNNFKVFLLLLISFVIMLFLCFPISAEITAQILLLMIHEQ